MQRLLADGADPNAQDEGGWSVLILASISGNADIVKLLLAAGADPNLRDWSDSVAHEYAKWNNYPELALRIEQAASSE